MTQRILWIIALSAALTLTGCESQEQTAPETAPQQVVKPDQTADTESKSESVEEQVSASVKDTAEAVEETAEKAIATASEAMEDSVKAIEEKATTVEEKTKETASALVAEVTPKPSGPEEVVIEASYGNVTLPHSMHADAYQCTTCHGDVVPAAMSLGKDAAHELCRGCHKDEGAGPTSCKGCHKK